MNPVRILPGIATIQIKVDDAAIRNVYLLSAVVLKVNAKDGRTGTMTIWSDNQIGSGMPHIDKFHGPTWSLIGTGRLIQKAEKHPSQNEGDLYGVIALWPVMGEAADVFARFVEKNALASVSLEIGCQTFGIFRSLKNPTVFSLIEVFDNATSFNQHLETKHFREFAEYAQLKYLGDRSQTVKGIAWWL